MESHNDMNGEFAEDTQASAVNTAMLVQKDVNVFNLGNIGTAFNSSLLENEESSENYSENHSELQDNDLSESQIDATEPNVTFPEMVFHESTINQMNEIILEVLKLALDVQAQYENQLKSFDTEEELENYEEIHVISPIGKRKLLSVEDVSQESVQSATSISEDSSKNDHSLIGHHEDKDQSGNMDLGEIVHVNTPAQHFNSETVVDETGMHENSQGRNLQAVKKVEGFIEETSYVKVSAVEVHNSENHMKLHASNIGSQQSQINDPHLDDKKQPIVYKSLMKEKDLLGALGIVSQPESNLSAMKNLQSESLSAEPLVDKSYDELTPDIKEHPGNLVTPEFVQVPVQLKEMDLTEEPYSSKDNKVVEVSKVEINMSNDDIGVLGTGNEDEKQIRYKDLKVLKELLDRNTNFTEKIVALDKFISRNIYDEFFLNEENLVIAISEDQQDYLGQFLLVAFNFLGAYEKKMVNIAPEDKKVLDLVLEKFYFLEQSIFPMVYNLKQFANEAFSCFLQMSQESSLEHSRREAVKLANRFILSYHYAQELQAIILSKNIFTDLALTELSRAEVEALKPFSENLMKSLNIYKPQDELLLHEDDYENFYLSSKLEEEDYGFLSGNAFKSRKLLAVKDGACSDESKNNDCKLAPENVLDKDLDDLKKYLTSERNFNSKLVKIDRFMKQSHFSSNSINSVSISVSQKSYLSKFLVLVFNLYNSIEKSVKEQDQEIFEAVFEQLALIELKVFPMVYRMKQLLNEAVISFHQINQENNFQLSSREKTNLINKFIFNYHYAHEFQKIIVKRNDPNQLALLQHSSSKILALRTFNESLFANLNSKKQQLVEEEADGEDLLLLTSNVEDYDDEENVCDNCFHMRKLMMVQEEACHKDDLECSKTARDQKSTSYAVPELEKVSTKSPKSVSSTTVKKEKSIDKAWH
jgi:hypothetical protein